MQVKYISEMSSKAIRAVGRVEEIGCIVEAWKVGWSYQCTAGHTGSADTAMACCWWECMEEANTSDMKDLEDLHKPQKGTTDELSKSYCVLCLLFSLRASLQLHIILNP